MKPWQKRQQFADRMSKSIGVLIVLVFMFVGALQTTVLSAVPFPKTLEFQGHHEGFVACFEHHAKLTQADGVTTYHNYTKNSENRIRLVQVKGFLGPSSSRAMYIDILEGRLPSG